MQTTITRTMLVVSGLCLAAGDLAAQETAPLGAGLINLEGEEIGTVSLRPAGDGILVELEASGLPPSQYISFHMHEGNTCDPADGFESAGGHYAPEGNPHGFLAEGGPHAGDMPNQYVSADGSVMADIYNDRLSIDGDNSVSGRTLIIHSGTDDYVSQPSGDAGDRIACGVVE